MHVKKIIIIASCVLLLCVGIVGVVFFSQGKEETIQKGNVYQTSSYITEEMKAKVQKCDVNLCLSEEYTPEKLLKDADEIVIASVISIDSAAAREGLFGMTRGKIVINNSLKGNFKTGEIVEYAKNGGIFTMAEWEATQPEAANAKRAYLRQKEGLDLDLNNTYIEIGFESDCEIEEGKTYLMYLKKYEESYEIIGLDIGLREVDMPKVDNVTPNSLDVEKLKVKNNKTGEFEPLDSYINTHIIAH